MSSYEEFEKEFPKLSHLRYISDPSRYVSRVTREWFIYFCMHKAQEYEIKALTDEVANLKALTELQASSIEGLCYGP